MTPRQLADALPDSVLAFRGYNYVNLGRSRELLMHPVYGPTVERHLAELSQAAASALGRPVDLVPRVLGNVETSIDSYGDAVALIVAMEFAQLDLLQHHFGIDYRAAQFSFGYSLGEVGALAAGGVVSPADALRVLLSLADDCVALAEDVTLGVVFTRALELPLDDVRRVCLEINAEGRGVIGVSSHLAPNSVLLMGQRDTLDRFLERVQGIVPERIYVRKNEHRWPPLHTPIMWERNIANRAARAMHTLPIKLDGPVPNVLSLVTGHFSYSATTTRDLLHRWVDHPQRLWDAIYATLANGIPAVVHIGPGPNIIPATFKRLKDNVVAQLADSLSLRALSAAAKRTWLARLLPERAALLRAPYVEHVILEDWLLDHAPAKR
jgi:[acyl-carrier-protein] S-malonyltransferase